MTRPIHLFTSDLLEYYGAVIEQDGESVNAVMPEFLRLKLGLPEYSTIVFSPNAGEGSFLVSYGSEIFKRFSKLVSKQGYFSEVQLPSTPVNIEKFEKKACDKIVLKNAVYKVEKHEIKKVSYLSSYFKYYAISEEKREGISSIIINEWNLSANPYNGEISEFLTQGNSKSVNLVVESSESQEILSVLEALKHAQSNVVLSELEEFIGSIERRLNKDIHRVNEYYKTLIREINDKIRVKAIEGEEKDKYQNKIKTIETELKFKEQDLIDRYSINISIEPISFIRFYVETPILWLHIKRRKLSRLFPVAYNPILGTADTLPCESCFNQDSSYYICDDKLHILCNECFIECPTCKKQYCNACYKTGCPRCSKNSKI